MDVQILFFRAGDKILDVMKREDGTYDVFEDNRVVSTCEDCQDALDVFHSHMKAVMGKVRDSETGR